MGSKILLDPTVNAVPQSKEKTWCFIVRFRGVSTAISLKDSLEAGLRLGPVVG